MIRLFLLANLLIGALAVNAQHTLELRQTEKQRLDSTITEFYDHPTMSWYNYKKEEYTYDSDQRVTLKLEYRGNSIDNKWENNFRYEYTYDEYGNQASVTKYYWNTDLEQWTGQYGFFHTYTYDAEGKKIQFFYHQWDNDTEQWVDYLSYQYEYDDNSRLISTELQQWADSYNYTGWYDYKKYENTYDNDGNIIQQIDYNAAIGGWKNDEKTEYTYYPDNTRLSEEYDWKSITEEWVASKIEEETYDDSDNLIAKITHRKDTNNLWLPQADHQYLYDDNNNRMEYILKSQWDTDTEQWTSIGTYEYNHDNTYTYDDLILPDVDPELFRHKYDSYILYLWYINMPVSEPCARGIHHYSPLALTSNEPIAQVPIRIFPNPANDIINFDLESPTPATVTIHDAQGKHIGTQHLQNNQLPVSHLNSGVYFYELFYNGEMFGGKFIVK